MTIENLPKLPLEILQQIAAHVSVVHQPSLFTFSLTNHTCNLACRHLIFEHISIVVYNAEIVRREVAQLSHALSRTDSARHVRCITVKGALQVRAPKPIHTSSWLDWWRGTGLDEIIDKEELIGYSGRHVVYDEGVIEKGGQEDMAWRPFVHLIETIPHLTDLVYDCKSQLPPSLLRTLHERKPHCRLHHLTFRFRTLLWGTPFPYEMELATSPSLYRIKAPCSERDTDGDDDFNQEAIRELVAGLAPNLKEVVILDMYPMRSGIYIRPREPWQGLPGFIGKKKGSLTSLAIKGHTNLVKPDLLKKWFAHTDFTCLEHLALEGCHDPKTSVISGDTMEWVAQNCSFPRTKTLSVYLARDDMFVERPHYSEQAISFFRGFANLRELSIMGPLDSNILDAVLSHHGQTLKKLSLEPHEDYYNISNGRARRDIPLVFTKEHIQLIATLCPVIEELAIPVKRNKSGASEVQLYRSFGEMECLRSLFLTLDCSNWRIKRDDTYDPHFDGEDDEIITRFPWALKRGIVKEGLINCAVDEALARSIWQAIAQGKRGRRLERLKLWPTGADQYGSSCSTSSHREIINNLSRSWLIELPVRDGNDEIIVKELGKQAREARDRRNWHSSDDYIRVFRSIWPCSDDTESWRGHWKSFPLQL